MKLTLLLLLGHGRGFTPTHIQYVFYARHSSMRSGARNTTRRMSPGLAFWFTSFTRKGLSAQIEAETPLQDKERNRFASYLKKAVGIIESYPGRQQPFSLYLKQTLATDRRAGAQDRRRMRQYCYPYFRLGYALQNLPTDEKIILALYLTTNNVDTPLDPLISILKPQWIKRFHDIMERDNNNQMKPTIFMEKLLDTRLRSSGCNLSWTDIFPFDAIQVSSDIPRETWLKSILVQPSLFIRTRPGKFNTLISQLLKANVVWKTCNIPNCIQLPSATNLDFVQGALDRDYVVQDYSSQRVGELFQLLGNIKIGKVWDSCAGSGGKSLLALDTLTYNTSSIHLTVSDKRLSILNQLKKRFIAANVQVQYNVLELDLEQTLGEENVTALIHGPFDLVIADVPCTGSGTWARTPEQLCCFKEEMLNDFVTKQRRILTNLPKAVQSGGYLLYCTCSVFEKENEEQVAWFTQTYGFTVEKSIIFNGIEHGADVLFASLMRKE